MRLFKPDTSKRHKPRHSIDLHSRNRLEKSVSMAFKVWLGAYAVAMAIGLTIASAHSAPSLTSAMESQAVATSQLLTTPNAMQSGGLLFQSKEAGRYIEAPKVATDIKLDVTGPVARAIVTQRFLNPSDAWLEGIYVFPLPDNAAVDQLKMKIGDRLIEGLIKPKQEARALYEAAKRDGKKASLLEQQRPNLFTNAVANIGPHESITIQIEYQQTIPRKDDQFSLRVPLVVAPRYNPQAKPLEPVIEYKSNQQQNSSGWGSTDPVPDREKISAPVLEPKTQPKTNPVTLTVALKAGFPLEDVVSHYHDVTIKPGNDDTITLSLKEGAVPADKDFLLTWTGKAGKTPNLGLFTQTLNGGAQKGVDGAKTAEEYLLAYITPPYKLTKTLTAPNREVIFVIDQSGSMAGPSIKQAKSSLIEALGQLKPQDKFQIIRFNNQMNQLFRSAKTADRETIDMAQDWVRSIKAEGGTEMLPAMFEALKDNNPDALTLRQVIFLTDGAIGNERQLFEAVKSKRGRSRIFTVGIGSAPNSFFMSRAAEVGRGTFTHIGDIGAVKSKMSKLFTQLTTPAATDLEIEFEGGEGIEASPSALPDLYLGEPVILAVKAQNLGKTLTLKGRFDNQPWTMSVDVSKAAKSQAIDKLWARGKIRQLENERLLSNDNKTVDKAIEGLGLKHHLVTRLTSLVAVDVTPSRPKETLLDSKKVPLNLPDGWEMDKVFGADAEVATEAPSKALRTKALQKKFSGAPAQSKLRLTMSDGDFAQSVSPLLAAKSAPRPAPMQVAIAPNAQQQIMLPRTATSSNLLIGLGIALLLLAGSLFAWMQWRRVGTRTRPTSS